MSRAAMPAKHRIGNRNRNKRGAASASVEFAPALYVFLFLVLFPLLDLMAMAAGATSVYLIANRSATRAGTAATLGDALQNSAQEAITISQSGIGHFLNLQPNGGNTFNGAPSGVTLYAYVTPIGGGSTTIMGPLSTNAVVNPVDSTKNIYEYTSEVSYYVSPLLNLRSVPFVGAVPGLGQPMLIHFTGQASAEYPEGMGNPATTSAAAAAS